MSTSVGCRNRTFFFNSMFLILKFLINNRITRASDFGMLINYKHVFEIIFMVLLVDLDFYLMRSVER